MEYGAINNKGNPVSNKPRTNAFVCLLNSAYMPMTHIYLCAYAHMHRRVRTYAHTYTHTKRRSEGKSMGKEKERGRERKETGKYIHIS